MPKRHKLVTMEELFTREELERAREIFDEYKDEPRYVGERKVSDEIVKPKHKITEYTGYDSGPEYWSCLPIALLQHKLYSDETTHGYRIRACYVHSLHAGGHADVQAAGIIIGCFVRSQTLWPSSSENIAFALFLASGHKMKGLMKDLAKTLSIIFSCVIVFFWLTLIFKFAVVMDRHATEQIVTE